MHVHLHEGHAQDRDLERPGGLHDATAHFQA